MKQSGPSACRRPLSTAAADDEAALQGRHTKMESGMETGTETMTQLGLVVQSSTFQNHGRLIIEIRKSFYTHGNVYS